MLDEYLKKNYPEVLQEYLRSKKTFDELFKVGDLVEYISIDMHGKVFPCWRLFYIKKVFLGEDSGTGVPWGDNYYIFSEVNPERYKDGRDPTIWTNLILVESEWWKTLRPMEKLS